MQRGLSGSTEFIQNTQFKLLFFANGTRQLLQVLLLHMLPHLKGSKFGFDVQSCLITVRNCN